MGISAGDLSGISQDGTKGKEGDPGRILREHQVQPEVCPPLAERSTAREAAAWEPAGYPWSVRVEALLPQWMPWNRKRFHLRPEVARQLLKICPRQMDRRLKPQKTQRRRRLYERTKTGYLLKHDIPVKADRWDVQTPGFTEADLV